MIPKVLVSDDVIEVLLRDGWHQIHRQSFVVGPFKVWKVDGEAYIKTGGWSAHWVEKTAEGTEVFMNVPLKSIYAFKSERKNPDDYLVSPLPYAYEDE